MKNYLLPIICFLILLSVPKVIAQKFVDFYKAGVKLNQEQKWVQSVEYFDAALKVSSTDTKAIASRTGRPSEYFPNRELGVAYFMQGKKTEAKRYLEKSFTDEPTERAVEYLRKIDSNWQDPRSLADIPKPPKPLFEKERLEKSAEIVEGGQSITFKVPVRNDGEGKFEKGLLRIVPQNIGKGIEFDPTVVVGDIRGSSSRTAQVTIRTNDLLIDGKASFVLKLENELGTVWDEIPISFKTQSPPVPLLRVVGLVASNDGKLILEKGRRTKAVKLLLKNEGRGMFNKPTMALTFNDQPITAGGATLTTILAGETVTIPCDLFVPSNFAATTATIMVNVREPGGVYNLSEKLTVPVQEPITPLVHFDKKAIKWEGTREGFITLLSQPTVKYNIINESDEPVKDLVVRMVQTPVNAGFSVPGSKKIAALESNKTTEDELKMSVLSKLLKGNQAKFTLRLENTQGKLLDKMEVEASILLPAKQTTPPPTIAETNALIDKVNQNLDSKFIARIALLGDQFDDLATKKDYLANLIKECLKKGAKVAFFNDIVPEELIKSGKFNEKLPAETYLNNSLIWYDNYQVDFQLEKALYSPIQFNEKGDAFLDVYVKKAFEGTSKSTDFKEVKVTNNSLLKIKYTFQRNKQKDGQWTSTELYIEGIERTVENPQMTETNFTKQQWDAKESEETNELMSLSTVLSPLVVTLKSKLPATAKKFVAEPFIEKNGKYADNNVLRVQNQLISELNAKRLKWIDAADWDAAKAVPGEDFVLEGKYEMLSSGLKLSLTLRNFRTFEVIAETTTNIGLELLGIVKNKTNP